MTPLLPEWRNVRWPVIGMLHVPPLPGAPANRDPLPAIAERVLRDAAALAEGGVHGLMVENFGDAPFYPARVPAHTIAQMTRIAALVRERLDLPLGINMLRNDGRGALAVAHAVGAQFIRVNVLSGARVADQGILHGMAHTLLRERVALQATEIRILADVNVKHSAALGAGRPLDGEVADLCARGGADALIVSGPRTGQPIDLDELRVVRSAAGRTPVLVGSGVTPDNVAALLPHCDALIVGSALKRDGRAAQPVDRARVTALLARIAEVRAA